jgi:hypothetical protein
MHNTAAIRQNRLHATDTDDRPGMKAAVERTGSGTAAGLLQPACPDVGDLQQQACQQQQPYEAQLLSSFQTRDSCIAAATDQNTRSNTDQLPSAATPWRSTQPKF